MTNEFINDDLVKPDQPTTTDLVRPAEQKERNIEDDSIGRATQAQPDSNESTALAGSATGVAAVRAKAEEKLGPLFSSEEANNFRVRWDGVQAAFVDEPRQAVVDADRPVGR